MNIKGIIDEDFVNYKKCAMFIAFPTCSWKCGKGLCQNSALAMSPDIFVSPQIIVERYITNPLSEAIVCGGLEPIDSFPTLLSLIDLIRERDEQSDIVIYTGYNKDEISDEIQQLVRYPNIVIKFGRFQTGNKPHFDEILGVQLSSDNQYGEKIS